MSNRLDCVEKISNHPKRISSLHNRNFLDENYYIRQKNNLCKNKKQNLDDFVLFL